MQLKGKALAAQDQNAAEAQKQIQANKKAHPLLAHFQRFFWLYLFLVPAALNMYLFKLRPMYGIQIAFRDYNMVKGIWASEWIGLKQFEELFTSVKFLGVLRNSIYTSFVRMLWGFPAPIILALALNEMAHQRYKKTMQTLLYLPHFISWVVVITLVTGLLSESTGLINILIVKCGGEKIPFLTSVKWFRPVLIIADIWKGCGWGTVIYLASLAGVDPSLYEAAMIDGANRWQRMRYITLPCIMATVTITLIMRMGHLLSNGFEEIWLLRNSLNAEVAEVLETYSYQIGLRDGRFSFATANGMFTSVVGFLMITASNFISKKTGGASLV